MKIKGIHTECGREVMVEQILESHGHCPWDGKPFTTEYTALLANALAKAELSGTMFEEALEEIADMGGELTLVAESVTGDINGNLERLRTRARKPAGAR